MKAAKDILRLMLLLLASLYLFHIATFLLIILEISAVHGGVNMDLKEILYSLSFGFFKILPHYLLFIPFGSPYAIILFIICMIITYTLTKITSFLIKRRIK